MLSSVRAHAVLIALLLAFAYGGARILSFLDHNLTVGSDRAFDELVDLLSHLDVGTSLPAIASVVAVFAAVLSSVTLLSAPVRDKRARSVGALGTILALLFAVGAVSGTKPEWATLIQVCLVGVLVQIELTFRQRLTLSGVVPLAFVSSYFGLYQVNAPITPTTLLTCAGLLAGYDLARAGRRLASRPDLRIVVVVAAVSVIAVILITALIEYGRSQSVAYAPVDEPWRSLYFSLILTAYVVLVIPLDASTSRAHGQLRLTLALTAALMVGIPVLVTFTPHGIVLAVSSAVWLIAAYFLWRHRYVSGARRVDLRLSLAAVVLACTLFALLALDRLVYVDPSSTLSPVIPLMSGVRAELLALPAIIFSALAVLPRVRAFVGRQWGQLTTPTGLIGAVVVAFSAALLAFAYGYFLVAVASYNELRSIFDMTFAAPPLTGFGGVNAWSWAGVAFAINLTGFAVAAVTTSVRRLNEQSRQT